jgi:hypothetical protein
LLGMCARKNPAFVGRGELTGPAALHPKEIFETPTNSVGVARVDGFGVLIAAAGKKRFTGGCLSLRNKNDERPRTRLSSVRPGTCRGARPECGRETAIHSPVCLGVRWCSR